MGFRLLRLCPLDRLVRTRGLIVPLPHLHVLYLLPTCLIALDLLPIVAGVDNNPSSGLRGHKTLDPLGNRSFIGGIESQGDITTHLTGFTPKKETRSQRLARERSAEDKEKLTQVVDPIRGAHAAHGRRGS
jgi:hypothetical protein